MIRGIGKVPVMMVVETLGRGGVVAVALVGLSIRIGSVARGMPAVGILVQVSFGRVTHGLRGPVLVMGL